MWFADVFLIVVGEQWSSLTQRNKIYQALTTWTMLFSMNLGFGLFIGIVANK